MCLTGYREAKTVVPNYKALVLTPMKLQHQWLSARKANMPTACAPLKHIGTAPCHMPCLDAVWKAKMPKATIFSQQDCLQARHGTRYRLHSTNEQPPASFVAVHRSECATAAAQPPRGSPDQPLDRVLDVSELPPLLLVRGFTSAVLGCIVSM